MAALSRRGRGNAPQLSCERCRERKVKCDKLDPCTGCIIAGVSCKTIYRDRLPRGRHARKSIGNLEPSTPRVTRHANRRAAVTTAEASYKELRERVENLETLLQSMANQGTVPPTTSDITAGRAAIRADRIPTTRRDRSEQPEQCHPRSSEGVLVDVQPSHNNDAVLCVHAATQMALDGGVLAALGIGTASHSPVVDHQTGSLLDATGIARLVGVYFVQIDPILKMLHRPSVERLLLHEETCLEISNKNSSADALQNAICYAAAGSMTDQQSRSLLGKSKLLLSEELCSACERSLVSANLISTSDMAVLQAFVLYLFARKSFDVSTSTWTLVSIAVRIGEKLRLYKRTKTDEFFETQMKVRLWLTICMLDYQTAMSQRSDPLIDYGKVKEALAQLRHVNDADFGPSSLVAIEDQEDLTDMTFAYVLFQHQLAGRLLNFDALSENESEETRQGYAREFEEKALGVLRFCDPESSQLAWFTWHATQCHIAIIRVSRLRPLCKSLYNSDGILQCPARDSELLRMTLRVLEKTQMMHTDPRGEPYRWYSTMPWPMLATALSACGSCSNAELTLQGWPVLEWWYRQHEALIAQSGDDPSQGVLASAMKRASTNIAALSSQDSNGVSTDETNVSRSLLDTSTNMGFDNPGAILDEHDTCLNPNLDLALGVFDSLPWFADATSGELDAMFFNDWDFSHPTLE
ncbi:hypothetical protein M438DRAFT_359184 [Aureobasidium pullulans EXF-150]|uniref:Zn(2)-C6 fungal-type domain-containing protein n=1 Tax=Aureobasidium pullulans EXF-150 TaxID=1043002 RepID=A0A074X3A2_AURPU|nr:uncharacterized protein M438DRAFT_359184 [Aureobasidium pullulans EXF-150]KEQ79995.1 hypothetical protein M438DRAFT_359184 [Aureobasidium pullulans EXF-150]